MASPSRSTTFWSSGARALTRDWRAGELGLLLFALAVAVAAVVSVGSLADRLGAALAGNSAQMLGGDLALQGSEPASEQVLARAGQSGLEVSRHVRLSSMASWGATMRLVSLKAVDAAYPLRGALRLRDDAQPDGRVVRGGPPPGSVWIDPQLAATSGLRPGDSLQLGVSTFAVAGVIDYEPDRGVQFINVAPRVMMRLDDLAATGLAGQGSRLWHVMLVAGAADAVNTYHDWLQPLLERGQRLLTPDESRPEIQRSLQRAQQFLLLVALLAVLIAAVAVALAARRFNRSHQQGYAVMRCLGASRSQLAMMLGGEFALLAFLAWAMGSIAGYAVQEALARGASGWLGVQLPPAGAQPIAHGLITCCVLLAGFAAAPLAALVRSAPMRALREAHEAALPRRVGWAVGLAGSVALLGLAWWMSGDLRLALTLGLGFIVALCVFALTARACLVALGWGLRHARGPHTLRFAAAGMTRRASLTVTQVCALAAGLMALLLLAMTRTDLLAGWQNTLPANAPNTFLINIQPDQREPVLQMLHQAGLDVPAPSPMVRARLTAINDTAVDAHSYQDERAQRMVEREFNLSYLDALPASNEIVRGRWLDPQHDEVTLEEGLAQTLGIDLGDELEFEVAGEPVRVRVTSLRKVKWDSFDVNFFAVLTAHALRDAPATYIASFHLPSGQAGLSRQLVQQFPNLTVVDVDAVLDQLRHIVDQAVQGVQMLFFFSLAAGVLVLGAAFAATRDERMHETAILRVLGARGRQLRASLYAELTLLGALAGLLAAAGATTTAWLLANHVFEFGMSWPWWPWPAGVAAGVAAACGGGWLALRGVLDTPPMVCLRKAV